MWRRSASYHRKESLCEAPAPEMTLGYSLSAALRGDIRANSDGTGEHLVAVLPYHACTISATLTLEVQRCMLRRERRVCHSAHHSRALQPLVPRGLHPSTRLHSAHWSDCLGQRRITQRIGRTSRSSPW